MDGNGATTFVEGIIGNVEGVTRMHKDVEQVAAELETDI